MQCPPGIDCFDKYQIFKDVFPGNVVNKDAMAMHSAALVLKPGFSRMMVTSDCMSKYDLGLEKITKNPIAYIDLKINSKFSYDYIMEFVKHINLHNRFFLHISNTISGKFVNEHVFEIPYLFKIIDYFYSLKLDSLHVEIADKIIYNFTSHNLPDQHPYFRKVPHVTINGHNKIVKDSINELSVYALNDSVKSFRVSKELYVFSDTETSIPITTVYRRIGSNTFDEISL